MSQGSEISGIDNIYPDTLVLHNIHFTTTSFTSLQLASFHYS